MNIRIAFFCLLLGINLSAHALPDAVTAVSPAPGATSVDPATNLTITFPVPASYAYTDNRKLRLIESATGIEVFSIDPGSSDPQSGQDQYTIVLPALLKPGTQYHVELDQGFARVNQAPWNTGAHDGSEWFFTTASLAAGQSAADNIVSLFPAPGAGGVPITASLQVEFAAPANFAYTDYRYLVVRDVTNNTVVFEVDPDETHENQGETTLVVDLAGLLQPETTYEVTLDYALAGVNVAPWKTGAVSMGVWQFTTAPNAAGAVASSPDGVLAVNPAPGSSGVPIDAPLSVHFSADTSYAATDGSSLQVIDTQSGETVFTVDPDESHPANGSRTFTQLLPAGVLQADTHYTVVMDYQFARFTTAPWRSTELASGWSFTTGSEGAARLNDTDGVSAVYPADGGAGVSPDTHLEVHFTARSRFGYTEGNSLTIVDTRDEMVVASFDPAISDDQEGSWSYFADLPITLADGVTYRADLDYGFARFNEAPWVAGDASWTFTVAGNLAPEPETPAEEPPANDGSDPTPDPEDTPVAGGGETPPIDQPPADEPPGEPAAPAITDTDGTILFVTQTPLSGVSFGTVVSNFSNHVPTARRAPRGGDLWIRYPDGTLRNLTAEAGFGEDGAQAGSAIAVRSPSVHWDGDKALFSMVVGSPELFETTQYFWQIYEVTGLGQGQQVSITKVPNQPVDYNNVGAIYAATNDDIIFVSDITPGGRHLYPQYEEYDGAPITTGMFRLNPATGDLLRLTHAPSGDFTPIIDDFGRLIFVRWDHLQQDQQNGNLIGGLERFGAAVNYVDESPGAQIDPLGALTESFPEHLVDIDPATNAPYVVNNETGHRFNQFFLWEGSPVDGSHNEVLNHLGRQELGQSYTRGRFVDDPALTDITTSILGGHTANTVPIFAPGGTFHPKEDPNQPGTFVMTHAQEFAFCGEILEVDSAPGINPEDIQFQKRSEYFDVSEIDGCYRNPLPLADDVLVAAWAPHDIGNEDAAGNGFRLRFVNEDGTPGGYLTGGINESVSYYSPDFQISHSGNLWELDPVEVRARTRPQTVLTKPDVLEAPEQQACEAAFGSTAACNTVMADFRDYLEDNKLALVVSRNVTARDDSDTQQPFNLRVPGGVTSDSSFGLEKVYDITHLQFLQANLVRGYANRPTGRRPLAQNMADDLADSVNNSIDGAVEIGADGSVAAIVPAERAVTWHLVDEAQGMQSVVSERYWVSFAAGEVRVCANCHGINDVDQMGNPPPANPPQAFTSLLQRWMQDE